MEKIPFPPSFPPERNLEQGFIRLEIQAARHRLNVRSAIPKLQGSTLQQVGSESARPPWRSSRTWKRSKGQRRGEERSDSGGCHLRSWFLGPQGASAGPTAEDKVAGQGGRISGCQS